MIVINGINDILRRIRVRHSKEGKRRSDESIITIEEVCAELKSRGDFSGSYEDLVKHVRMFFNEMSFHLADGTSIVIDVDERKERGSIDSFTDTGTAMVNERITPGRKFIVTGDNIRIEGNKADCGVWFVSMVDASLRFKVTKALSENSSGRVSGIVPVIPAGKYIVEIKTQYNGDGALLKAPRTIKGGFALRNYKILAVKDEEKNN